MNKFKYLSMAVLSSLALSSCNDFLDKEIEDSLTTDQYLTSDDNLLSFTWQLYGAYTWNTYETKFSWCANELTVGNVYHNYGDEGAFFFLSFDNKNANLLDGYQGLYGVISRCNMIINDIKSQVGKGVSETAVNRAIGEAKMFRGMAYFLLAEYWGKSMIVLDNVNVIASDNAFNIPLASRRCLFAQVEKDWTEAADLLPEKRWGANQERVTKASALAMLAKLYLTEAAASVNSDPAIAAPFNTTESFANLNAKASQKAQEAISAAEKAGYELVGKGGATVDQYEDIFKPRTFSKEILFALHFENGPYGAGSSRQVQFGRSKYLNSGFDAYGGEKGLTQSLFTSFASNDIRKRACCYFEDQVSTDEEPASKHTPKYTMYDGSEYYYLYNPNQTFDNGAQPFGSEAESKQLNNCRKFVYGFPSESQFSVPISIAFMRMADLYLIKAEAEMALETGAEGVSVKTPVGNADINVIRKRAGVAELSAPFALYDTDIETKKKFTYEDASGDIKEFQYTVYNTTPDLFEERRHEFALENQNWLDLKRIYYRNVFSAKEFLARQDRGFYFGHRYGMEGTPKQYSDYQRQKEIHMIDPKEPEETPVDVDKVQWFFPLPLSISSRVNTSNIYDDVDAIKSGKYQY